MNIQICDTCKYFGMQVDHGWQKIECGDDGACRLNPPFVLSSGDGEGGFCTIFPPVNREDWCGRWSERDAS